jgi:hypothetical protein
MSEISFSRFPARRSSILTCGFLAFPSERLIWSKTGGERKRSVRSGSNWMARPAAITSAASRAERPAL